MNTPEYKKHEYWNHFVTRWAIDRIGGGNGITAKKLARIKPSIFGDDAFWLDVIFRHDGLRHTPEELMLDSATYSHCLGNFWGMLYQSIGAK
jgi:hypothetical protein